MIEKLFHTLYSSSYFIVNVLLAHSSLLRRCLAWVHWMNVFLLGLWVFLLKSLWWTIGFSKKNMFSILFLSCHFFRMRGGSGHLGWKGSWKGQLFQTASYLTSSVYFCRSFCSRNKGRLKISPSQQRIFLHFQTLPFLAMLTNPVGFFLSLPSPGSCSANSLSNFVGSVFSFRLSYRELQPR